MNDKAE